MSMKTKTPKETINKILEYRKQGATYREIGELVEMNPKTVEYWVKKHTQKRKNGKCCPKCHRGPFPVDFKFCPYCQADMQTEKEKLINLVEQTQKTFKGHIGDDASRVIYCCAKVLEYLRGVK